MWLAGTRHQNHLRRHARSAGQKWSLRVSSRFCSAANLKTSRWHVRRAGSPRTSGSSEVETQSAATLIRMLQGACSPAPRRSLAVAGGNSSGKRASALSRRRSEPASGPQAGARWVTLGSGLATVTKAATRDRTSLTLKSLRTKIPTMKSPSGGSVSSSITRFGGTSRRVSGKYPRPAATAAKRAPKSTAEKTI